VPRQHVPRKPRILESWDNAQALSCSFTRAPRPTFSGFGPQYIPCPTMQGKRDTKCRRTSTENARSSLRKFPSQVAPTTLRRIQTSSDNRSSECQTHHAGIHRCSGHLGCSTHKRRRTVTSQALAPGLPIPIHRDDPLRRNVVQVNAGRAQIAVPQALLNLRKRHALIGKLARICMAQSVKMTALFNTRFLSMTLHQRSEMRGFQRLALRYKVAIASISTFIPSGNRPA
jgi:hypothetical protein